MFKLSETFVYKNTVKLLKNTHLPKTSVPFYNVFKILLDKLITFDIDQRAAAVSYSFLLAIFPGIIFLFTLIPYIPIKNLDLKILEFMQDVMPLGLYETAYTTIKDIVSIKRTGVLSFGFLLTVYAATSGMMALMRAFNMALKMPKKRTFLQERGIALLLTFLMLVILIIAILILTVGKFLLNSLETKHLLPQTFDIFLFEVLRYGSTLLIFYLGVSVVYYYAPAIKRKIVFFNFGGLLASVLAILATNLFSYYLSNFASYNRLYGSIGTLIALMVWIYLIAIILILGFEVNTSLREAFIIHENTKTPQQDVSGVL